MLVPLSLNMSINFQMKMPSFITKLYALVHISLASFYGTKTNIADLDQMPQNVASDQCLQCFLRMFEN